jgi:hypothetical protein
MERGSPLADVGEIEPVSLNAYEPERVVPLPIRQPRCSRWPLGFDAGL